MAADPYIGVDLKLANGDLGYTLNGDLDLVGQNEPTDNVWQAVALRLTTALGTNLFADNYGTNSGQYVDEPLTADLQAKIKSEVETTILQDPRVSAVSNMTISQGTESLTLSFSITTVSGSTQSGTVQIGG